MSSRYVYAPHLTGDILLEVLRRSGKREKELWRERYADEMTYDAYHGRLWKARHGITSHPELFQHDIGQPLELDGDWIVLGDVQLPTTDYDFATLPAVVAEAHLSRPRQLLIVGDLMNMDAFSSYENEIGLPSFRQEVEAARTLLSEWLTVFDRVVWLAGNHERRISKRTGGAFLMEDLAALINARIETSNFDRAIIHTPNGDWLAAHGTEYSVNQLTVGDMLAGKYRMHVISHHQHHLAIGWNRYKQNVIVDNGGLFNTWFMSYARLNTSKKPNMAQGFTMLKGGYPHVFGREPFTNWQLWLKDVKLPKAKGKKAA